MGMIRPGLTETTVTTKLFELQATNARDARKEAASRWSCEVHLTGYNAQGLDVYLSTVRERGNKAPVATAIRNRAGRPVKFFAEPKL
jgi:hypothetical protein